MKQSLPTHFSSSWKKRIVLQCHHSIFQNAMQFHIEKIRQTIGSKPQVYKKLLDLGYWDSLRKNANIDNEINKLQVYWGKVKPLAHLNSNALYFLLSEHVRPLEKYLENMLHELNSEDFKKEESSLWRPTWFDSAARDLMMEAQDNLGKVKMLKTKIMEAMCDRCELHQQFHLDYRIDDTLGVICQQLNGFQKDESARLMVPAHLSTIDDDTRITFYDVLKSSGFDKERIEQSVLAPIQKKSIKPLTTKEEVITQLQKTTLYVHQTLSSLNLDNIYRKMFSYKFTLAQTEALNAIISPVIQALKALGLYQLVKYKTLIGYFLLFAASLVIYGYCVQIIAPFLLATLSFAAINAVNSILFYTIGLAPLWYITIKYARQIRDGLNAILSAAKREQLVASMLALENAEYFIANRLSQSIVDLSHFDIQALLQQAEHHRAMLRTLSADIRHFTLRQKMTSSPAFRQTLTRAAARLNQQVVRIEKSLESMAMHIAANLGQEITLLCASIDKNQLVTSLSKHQLLKLQSMVNTYGSVEAKKLFAQNTDIIHLWKSHLDVEHMAFIPERKPKHYQPWGGYELRQDIVKGWNILLESLVCDEKACELLKQINGIVAGESFVQGEQLIEKVNTFFPQHAQDIINNMQWLVFNTLSPKRLFMANLLSDKQKNLITKWFNQYEAAISEAEKVMAGLFVHSDAQEINVEIDNDSLSNYYELLDAADIYYHALKQDDILKHRYNLARQFFEEYQGEHSRAFTFLKFVPKSEYPEMLARVARKRLHWLLDNVKTKQPKHIFDKSDGDLFHHFDLVSKKVDFDFEEEIRGCAQFNADYSVHMENFLSECQNHGFDGDSLLEKYQALNHTESHGVPCVQPPPETHHSRRKYTCVKVSRMR